jgi:hypothetical protein
MPAIPFIAVALGASGAFTAIGAGLAGIAGLSVATGGVAASLAAGTISSAAAAAIGAGAFSAAATAVQGGKASDVLKSAVIGGITSYAGSSIAQSVAQSVSSSAIASGTEASIAKAMGQIIGSASAGAITSGTSALLSGKDPINALLKGGLTAGMSAGIGLGVERLVRDVPALSNPTNNAEAALQRAVKSAIGATIASGGNPDAIGLSVLNSFVSTAGELVGRQIRDTSSKLSSADQQFRASEADYQNNLAKQESLAAQYNQQIKPLQDKYSQIETLASQYDDLANKYNNYDSHMTSQGYTLIGGGYDGDGNYEGDFYAKQVWVPARQASGYNDDGQYITWEIPGGYQWQRAGANVTTEKQAIYDQAMALNGRIEREATDFKNLQTQILGGEVTKYKTETQSRTESHYDAGTITVPVEVQVPYTETVVGSIQPIKNELDSLKSQVEPLGEKLVEAKNNLEKSVAEFNEVETSNAALVQTQINNFVSARDQYRAEFGVDPTEDQLKSFAASGDILGTVSKLVADNNNEQFAKEVGFRNYADYTAAGNISPNDFYAKQQGWQDYAQQLNAQANGYSNPSQWNTYVNNQQTAVNNGFINYQDYQSAGGQTSNDFYAKKEGWTDYAEKQQAEDAGFRNPTVWNTHVVEVKNQDAAKAAGFPDYETQTRFGNNINEYRAVQEGWSSLGEKQAAAGYEITSPQKYQEFISGKTEEDKIVQMLQDRGVPATPERVADIMKSWDFNPATPNVGFGEAFNKSDNLNISNSRADSVQEAAALAKSLGYSNFSFGGSEYKLNTAAPTQNPYDFFANFGEAYKAARADLGAGKNFEWRNPVTGETKTFSTNNEKEQAVADQKRIDLMPAYTGEGAYTRTGNPGIVNDVFYDKSTGNIVQDNRVWDSNGKLISGEVKNINPDASGSTAERLAASLKESFGKTFDAFKYVTSGINKGGWELLNQVGVLGGLTGLVDMNNWATKTAAEMKAVIDGYQNKEFLNNRALMNSAIAKAGNEGIFAQAVEAGKQFGLNPLQTAEFIAQQGANLFLGGGAMATARALGAGLSTQQAAAIGTMAAAQGASVADEAYKDAIKNGKPPEEAINSARAAWAGAALTSVVANKFIPGALSNESAIAAQAIAKNSLSTALKGEMSSELAEEVSGKVIGNIAAGNAWDKDVGATAVQALIGSGVITGLVQVSTTGSPSTAIAIAKDAGLTDAQIDEAKTNFQKAIDDVKTQTQSGNKVESYNIPDAVEKLSTALLNANLSASEVYQLQNLIALDATQSAIKTSLENSGVPAEFSGSIANQAAPQILEGSDVKQAFDNLSVILQANGFTPVDASLITNKTLTGTDVRQEIAEQLESQGYKANPEEIDNLISQNATAIPTEIASAVSDYADAKAVNREEAKESLVQAGIENPTQEQINFLAGQYDQALLQGRADTAVKIFEEPNFVEAEILKNIENNKIAGMDEAAAIEKAVTDIASSVGQSNTDLLALIGRTPETIVQQYQTGDLQRQIKTAEQIEKLESQLTDQGKSLVDQLTKQGETYQKALEDAITAQNAQITAGQTQTQTQIAQLDAATKAKFDQLSDAQKDQALQLAETTKDLQGSINAVAQQTAQQIEAGQQQTAQQIASVKDSLTAQIAANEAAGLSRDEATSKAIQDVAASVGTTKDALLAQIGQTEAGLQQQLATGQAQTQEQIAQLDAATQAKFNEMTEAQKAQALQLAQTTKDLQGSINTVAQQSQQQISDVQTALQTQLAQQSAQTQQAFADMTAAQKEEVAARIQQGQDLQTAISGVQTSLGEQITGGLASLSQDFQNKLAASDAATQAAFANMDATQKAETQSRVQLGQDLQAAIAASQQATEQKITGGLESLSQDFQSKLAASDTATQNSFAQMTAAQQQETRARVQQGVTLENAIAGVQTGLGEQITAGQKKTEQEISDLNKSLTDRITANEAAGLTRDQAISKSVEEVAAGLGSTRETLLSQINQTETTLKQQYETGQAAIRAELEAQRAADEAAKQEAERKAREEAEKAAARSRMSTGAGVLGGMTGAAGLAALGGVMPGTEEASKPLTAKYLTSKGGDTGFKGLLEEFQQEVEGAPNMPDNTANRQEGSDMSQYYSYGNETSLDQILGQDNTQESSFPQFFASGGLATPLMAAGGHTGTRYGKYAGGGMPSPLMAAGGKMRVDFRRGDAVTGPGDGQSDDIPAMLADGEFVFPADVVAAIGNGSTKAGSDALYDMMHSIRKHARSARPKDLPPEIKSPLDLLKKSRNKRRAK